jgi:hypothetical protein
MRSIRRLVLSPFHQTLILFFFTFFFSKCGNGLFISRPDDQITALKIGETQIFPIEKLMSLLGMSRMLFQPVEKQGDGMHGADTSGLDEGLQSDAGLGTVDNQRKGVGIATVDITSQFLLCLMAEALHPNSFTRNKVDYGGESAPSLLRSRRQS